VKTIETLKPTVLIGVSTKVVHSTSALSSYEQPQ